MLSDLKEAAAGDTPFHRTASGQSMPHHETAFIGEDVCTTRTVSVGTLTATWVFSEFETDAPFENVVGWIDLRGLLTSRERQQADVLNGIAYDADQKRIHVTGKLWPWVFQTEP